MHQNNNKSDNNRSCVNKPLVTLGNSSKEQLRLEAKKWAKDAQKESKGWTKMFIS